jgi:hypothetical protein
MYYVIAIARDYNLVISIRAGAPGGQSAAFATRLETCRGPIETINCNITIDFEWSTAGAGSGTGQVTIFSGTSGNSTVPAPGNALTYIGITNISSDCTGYNSIQSCPPFDSATTTTTTTSTTTTTTTTIIPVPYSDATVKQDQYSSSYNPGTRIWANLGLSGSRHDLEKRNDPSVNINSGGSGTALFLGVTSSLQDGGYYYCIDDKQQPFVSLADISFSYSILFRIENENPANSFYYGLVSLYSGTGSTNSGFSFQLVRLVDSPTNLILTVNINNSLNRLYQEITLGNPFGKWYLATLTFDKTQDSNNAAKLYINQTLVHTFSGVNAIPNPATFFYSPPGNASIFIGATLNPMKIAASIFWQNTALTQAQVQNLYNEYNSRYTLG